MNYIKPKLGQDPLHTINPNTKQNIHLSDLLATVRPFLSTGRSSDLGYVIN